MGPVPIALKIIRRRAKKLAITNRICNTQVWLDFLHSGCKKDQTAAKEHSPFCINTGKAFLVDKFAPLPLPPLLYVIISKKRNWEIGMCPSRDVVRRRCCLIELFILVLSDVEIALFEWKFCAEKVCRQRSHVTQSAETQQERGPQRTVDKRAAEVFIFCNAGYV